MDDAVELPRRGASPSQAKAPRAGTSQAGTSNRPYGAYRRFIKLSLVALALVVAGPAGSRADPPRKLLALGDSLTAGYGLPSDQSFTAQLQKALQAQGLAIDVVNGGVSGDTSAGGLARLDWLLADKPDYALVELGANDGLRGLDPQVTYDNLDAVLTRLGARKIPVLLAGMVAPPNLGREYGAQFNAVFTRLAAKHKVLLYPFFLDGVADDSALNQADFMHPNAKGVAVIVARMMPSVKQLIGGPA